MKVTKRLACSILLILLMTLLAGTSAFAYNDQFVNKSGYTYYYNKNGNLKTGFFKAGDGKYYYADAKGRIQKCGWKKIGTDKYYFSLTTGAAYVGGIKKIDGKYYYFAKNGKLTGDLGLITYQDNKYFIKASGEALTNSLRKINGKIYFFQSNAKMFKDGWRKVGEEKYYFSKSTGAACTGFKKIGTKYYYFTDLGYLFKGHRTIDGKLYQFSEKNGAAVFGLAKYESNSSDFERYYFFDPESEKGYLTGIQYDPNVDKWYYMDAKGAAIANFYTDSAAQKLYYMNPEDYSMTVSGTVDYCGLSFPVNEDGSLDYITASIPADTDSNATRLLKAAFSQLFKGYGGTGLPNTTPLDSISKYSCTEYVSRMFMEIGIDVGTSDIIDTCYELGSISPAYSDVRAGDILFWNIDNCYNKLDENGDPWTIDPDEDGICNRQHEPNDHGDGINYHVHHVSIALGNGQQIEAVGRKGIIIRDIGNSEDKILAATGHMF